MALLDLDHYRVAHPKLVPNRKATFLFYSETIGSKGPRRFERPVASGKEGRVMESARSQLVTFSPVVGNLLFVTIGLFLLSLTVSVIAVVAELHVVGSLGAFGLFAASLTGWFWLDRAEHERRHTKTA